VDRGNAKALALMSNAVDERDALRALLAEVARYLDDRPPMSGKKKASNNDLLARLDAVLTEAK